MIHNYRKRRSKEYTSMTEQYASVNVNLVKVLYIQAAHYFHINVTKRIHFVINCTLLNFFLKINVIKCYFTPLHSRVQFLSFLISFYLPQVPSLCHYSMHGSCSLSYDIWHASVTGFPVGFSSGGGIVFSPSFLVS